MQRGDTSSAYKGFKGPKTLPVKCLDFFNYHLFLRYSFSLNALKLHMKPASNGNCGGHKSVKSKHVEFCLPAYNQEVSFAHFLSIYKHTAESAAVTFGVVEP